MKLFKVYRVYKKPIFECFAENYEEASLLFNNSELPLKYPKGSIFDFREEDVTVLSTEPGMGKGKVNLEAFKKIAEGT